MKNSNWLTYFISIVIILFSLNCGEEKVEELPPDSGENTDPIGYQLEKEKDIRYYNLEERKKRAQVRTPCDTVALMEYILENEVEGTYLIDLDPSYTLSFPQSAVIYYRGQEGRYVYALIAKSRLDRGERTIEVKNIVGYDASFVDLDSTKLGTPFIFLTLFKCVDSTFQKIWEVPVPNHGGFHTLTAEKWKNVPYIRAYFHYGRGIGRLDYNYFFVDGMLNMPHLLLTIETINRKRTMVDINGDKYPDYLEYFFVDTGERLAIVDSVSFVWKDSLYVSKRDSRKTTLY